MKSVRSTRSTAIAVGVLFLLATATWLLIATPIEPILKGSGAGASTSQEGLLDNVQWTLSTPHWSLSPGGEGSLASSASTPTSHLPGGKPALQKRPEVRQG